MTKMIVSILLLLVVFAPFLWAREFFEFMIQLETTIQK